MVPKPSSKWEFYAIATTHVLWVANNTILNITAQAGIRFKPTGVVDSLDRLWLIRSDVVSAGTSLAWITRVRDGVSPALETTLTILQRPGCVSMAHQAPTQNSIGYIYLGCPGGTYTIPEALAEIGSAFNPSRNPNDAVYAEVGAGTYQVAKYHAPTKTLFLGADIGLGIGVNVSDATTMDILALFFVPTGNQITEVWVDEQTRASTAPPVFWGTSSGSVYRTLYLDYNSLSISAEFNPPPGQSQQVNAIVSKPGDPEAIALFGSTRNLDITKADCGLSECSSCQDDPYCGFCYSSVSCSAPSQCSPSSAIDFSTDVCLPPTSLTPAVGAVTGGTLVSISGTPNRFSATQASNLVCKWTKADDGATVRYSVVSSVTSNMVKCHTPAFPQADVPYNLSIQWVADTTNPSGTNGVLATPTETFTPYDCSVSTCNSKVSCNANRKAECGWCFASQQCSAYAACDGGNTNSSLFFNPNSCPLATTFAPQSASIRSTTNIVVQVTNFPAVTRSYKCLFGNVQTDVTGTTQSSGSDRYTSFSCAPPTASVDPATFSRISIVDAGTNKSYTGGPSENTFESYDCDKFPRCGLCSASGHDECRWCSGTGAACHYTTAGACTASGVCPSISAVSPQSFLAPNHDDIPIEITAHHLDTYEVGSAIRCAFADAQNPEHVLETDTSYTYHSDDTPYTLNCRTPLVTTGFDIGFWGLYITVAGAQQMDPIQMEVYDCSDQLCASCSTSLHTQCRWCLDTDNFGCGVTATAPSCDIAKTAKLSNATCPSIASVDPHRVALAVSKNIKFNGSFAPLGTSDQPKLKCGISSDLGATNASMPTPEATGSVTSVSSSEITCSFNGSVPGNYSLYLYETGSSLFVAASSHLQISDCEELSKCSDCVSASGCTFCAGVCTRAVACDASLSQLTCPVVSQVTPTYLEPQARGFITINGTGFLTASAKRAASAGVASMLGNLGGRSFASAQASAVYTCKWPQLTASAETTPNSIVCEAPSDFAYQPNQPLALTVLVNGNPYFDAPIEFTTFQCTNSNGTCGASNCAAQQYCGWCVGAQQCQGENRCDDGLWLSSCLTATASPLVSPLQGSTSVTFTLRSSDGSPLPTNFNNSELGCIFGVRFVAATSVRRASDGSLQSVTCNTPPSEQNFPNDVDAAVGYRRIRFADSPRTLSYVDCGASTSCDRCIATPNCGWCQSKPNQCTLQIACPNNSWSNKKCPINKLALGLGLAFGIFFLILLLLLIAYLIRRSRRKRGLIIQLREPDYDAIAWGNDVTLHYRIPDDRYATLLAALRRPGYLLQIGLSLNCPATEQDSLAKGLVYVACATNNASDMIRTIIHAEVLTCKEENTLFRSNSVASKMYKFYSRIVGIKYLYHCIARVILELEVLGKKQQQAIANPKRANDAENEVSLLSVSMELDTEKDLADDVDTDTNLLQLQLICQKILMVLIKTSLKNIPGPLREIFVEIDRSVSQKFPGSIDAIYKGLGGLFFLRFVCPAISAPHVYGLLPNPPNETTQRQLVLIAKVIQSIANMQEPGKKEQYMSVMSGFISSSIPRITKFYNNLREAANINTHAEVYERDIRVPDEVLLNGLAATQAVLSHEAEKTKAWAEQSYLSTQEKADLTALIDQCMADHDSAPKKVKQTGGGAEGSKKGKKKGPK